MHHYYYDFPITAVLTSSSTAQQLPSTVTSDIRPHIETNTTKIKINATQQQPSLTNQQLVDENQSTSINSQDNKNALNPNPHKQLSISASEPHMVHCRAWPTATTVLSQAQSAGTNNHPLSSNNAYKVKSRYIDILLPR